MKRRIRRNEAQIQSIELDNLVRKLVSDGNVSAMLRLLKYEEGRAPSDLDLGLLTRDELKLKHIAVRHLEFIEKYGTDRQDVEENGRWYFAYPEEFEAWLAAGRPGLSDAQLQTLIV